MTKTNKMTLRTLRKLKPTGKGVGGSLLGFFSYGVGGYFVGLGVFWVDFFCGVVFLGWFFFLGGGWFCFKYKSFRCFCSRFS